MKKLFLSFLLCIIGTAVSFADDWTDGNGVTWHYENVVGGVQLNGASNYGESFSIPSKIDGQDIISIGYSAFRSCSSLTSIGDLSACTSIGDVAFRECTSLTSIGDLSACTSIGYYAFRECTSLTSIGDLSACTSIGNCAFDGCSSLTSIGDLSACTSIGSGAFLGCRALTLIRLSSPTLCQAQGYMGFSGNTSIIVPRNLLDSYRNAPYWDEYALKFIPDDAQTEYDLTLTAKEGGSDLLEKVRPDNMGNVTSLKITGTINGGDIKYIRNKMFNLHCLDLSDATIVTDNMQEYGFGQYTQDSIIGSQMFKDLANLSEVKIPRSTKEICNDAFSGCSLTKITMYEGLTEIGWNAFCHNYLTSVEFPNSVKVIGSMSFGYTNVTHVTLPKYVERIEGWAFCSGRITELEIPSTVTFIGGRAFEGCPIREVKTKVVDPFKIDQSAFSCWTTATLYVPMDDEWTATYYKYYSDPQWGQFVNIAGWQPSIDNFYLDNDYELESGSIGQDGDKPDAELNPGSGLIVDGSGNQNMNEVHVKQEGDTGASIIDGNGSVSIETLYCDINVVKNKWYFFCFPFDVTLDNISAPGNWVFRYYDGKERADNGRGGWKNLPVDQTKLNAGIGYIFRTNRDGVLTIPVSQPDFSAIAENQKKLIANPSSNNQDASWNFVGNPYLSYYSIDDLKDDFDAPLTIWNGNNYEAVRPGDDDFLLQPYQAFFVQKPSAKDYIGFNAENQTTYTKGNNEMAKVKARRAKAQINPDRLLVNLTISDGENTDKTRVVFNDCQQMDYEMECDATKFLSDAAVPQLYSTYQNVNYAINERPNGNREVQLGFSTKKAGEFTIAAVRMDTPMVLKDNELGITFDLSIGEYTFKAEAGTYNNRFQLVGANTADGVKAIEADTQETTIYDLSGRRIGKSQKGVQIVKGKKMIVK